MANFIPLNNYSLFILDKLIEKYNLKPPFLDIACGTGYLSKHLAKKGWDGTAIDYSDKAINITKKNLKGIKNVKIEKKSLLKTCGKYNTILMFDILEHIKNDISTLKKTHSLLSYGGYLVIATPSNPKEWGYDDNFYGHIRRYTEDELKEKLIKTGFKSIICYDYTFPVFWLLRRIYMKISIQKEYLASMQERTNRSSFTPFWNISFISRLLNNMRIVWYPVYFIQYTFFKNSISFGNGVIVLAKKCEL